MTIAEFRVFYPQFDTIDDAVVQRYLDLFECQFTGDYDCMQDELQGLFTAHRLVMWQRTNAGSVGAVVVATSKSVGDESQSGFVAGAQDGGYGDYAATSFGVQFWTIILPYGSGGMMAESNYA
jgi:hypothetical protein